MNGTSGVMALGQERPRVLAAGSPAGPKGMSQGVSSRERSQEAGAMQGLVGPLKVPTRRPRAEVGQAHAHTWGQRQRSGLEKNLAIVRHRYYSVPAFR